MNFYHPYHPLSVLNGPSGDLSFILSLVHNELWILLCLLETFTFYEFSEFSYKLNTSLIYCNHKKKNQFQILFVKIPHHPTDFQTHLVYVWPQWVRYRMAGQSASLWFCTHNTKWREAYWGILPLSSIKIEILQTVFCQPSI